MERVLFVTSTRIGDAVMSSGLLAHLAETRPEARFTVAAGPLAAPLFRAAPRLDDVIVMDKRASGGHWLNLWRRTVGRAWDTVVDLRGSRTSWFLRAKTRRLAGRPRTDVHKVVEASDVLGLATPADPVVWLDAAAEAEADARVGAALAGGAPFLALSPSASAPFKEWPPERFAALARVLTGEGGALAGARVVLFGGPGDEATAQAVAAGLNGADALDLTGRLDLVAAAEAEADARVGVALAGGAPFLALSPSASAPFKEWPPERFAALARVLTGEDGALAGARVVLFGGPGDEATAQAVAAGLDGADALDLTGRLDLVAAAAILKRARLFVGNDSGLMHLAAAAGAPTLGLFGPTDERVYGPWGPKGRSVRAGDTITHAKKRDRLKGAETTLMGDLDVETAKAAAEALLAETR